jgi:hypothetical protein
MRRGLWLTPCAAGWPRLLRAPCRRSWIVLEGPSIEPRLGAPRVAQLRDRLRRVALVAQGLKVRVFVSAAQVTRVDVIHLSRLRQSPCLPAVHAQRVGTQNPIADPHPCSAACSLSAGCDVADSGRRSGQARLEQCESGHKCKEPAISGGLLLELPAPPPPKRDGPRLCCCFAGWSEYTQNGRCQVRSGFRCFSHTVAHHVLACFNS